MKLVDMKLPKLSKEELKKKNSICCENEDKYPWGLRMDFDEAVIEKIPALYDHEVGESLTITVQATVISKRMTENSDKTKRKRLEVQITAMGTDSKKADEKAFEEGAKK